MSVRGLEVCLLFNEPNIRYATGASAMPIYAMSTMVRCAVVPVEGAPILFEHGNSVHRSRLSAGDVRPMHAWEFFDDPQAEADIWARETADAIKEVGADGGVVPSIGWARPGSWRCSGWDSRSSTRRRPRRTLARSRPRKRSR